MSDCAFAPPLWMPDWHDVPKGARPIITAFLFWMDGRGSCDALEEDFVRFTGYEAKALGRHLKWLIENEWVSSSERRRLSNNELTGKRYWATEKLNALRRAWPVSSHRGEPDNLSGDGQNVGTDADKLSDGAPTKSPAADNLSGAQYRERGRARGRLSFYSISLSFAFRDDSQRVFMEGIIAVCGVGLANPNETEGLLDSLAEVETSWLEKGYDYALDILPCIKALTAYPRARPVTSFRLFDLDGNSDLANFRQARLAKEEAKAARAAGVKAPPVRPSARAQTSSYTPPPMTDARRAEKIAGFRRFLAAFDHAVEADDATGLESWRFELPSHRRHADGQWLIDELRPVAAAKRAELQRLLEDGRDGGGDGAQG